VIKVFWVHIFWVLDCGGGVFGYKFCHNILLFNLLFKNDDEIEVLYGDFSNMNRLKMGEEYPSLSADPETSSG